MKNSILSFLFVLCSWLLVSTNVSAIGCGDDNCDTCQQECCDALPAADCFFICFFCGLECESYGYWPDTCYWQPPNPTCSDYLNRCKAKGNPIHYCELCYEDCLTSNQQLWDCPN